MPISARAQAYMTHAATPIRLLDLIAFAKGCGTTRANGHKLVHEEITVRLAHQLVRAERLSTSPRLRTACAANLRAIGERIQHSFDEMTSVSIAERHVAAKHAEIFQRLKERHVADLPIIARAFKGLLDSIDKEHSSSAPYDELLENYFRASLGMNVLIDQSLFVDRDDKLHAAEREKPKAPRPLPGIVREATDLRMIVQDTAEIARELCDREYGDAPDTKISPEEPCVPPPADTSVPGVPHLFHAALLEVLKNAVRASTQRARASGSATSIAPVAISILSGDEDVSVVIDDRGAGIPRARADTLLFGYCRSTAPPPLEEDDSCARVGGGGADVDASRSASPLAGFGVGIPYARAQLRLFGGDLRVLTVHEFGTRVACCFPRFAMEIKESIPILP